MRRLSILALRRARVLSPGHESDDWRILESAATALGREGHDVRFGDEEQVAAGGLDADVVLNMCQGPRANTLLLEAEGDGTLLVNRPSAALACLRHRLLPRLAAAGVPIPEWTLVDTAGGVVPPSAAGWERTWVKRADVHATSPEDVVGADGESRVREALAAFAGRGLARAVLQRHLEGAVVKFYGVGRRLLLTRVVAGDRSASFDGELLRRRALQCARALGLDVFGGECVVTADGSLPVIDVNDWPSFAPCREEAALAIAGHVLGRAAERQEALACQGAAQGSD